MGAWPPTSHLVLPFHVPSYLNRSIIYLNLNLVAGEWFKGDVKQIIDNATATGADPTLSDAYTINGQPGFPNNCSNGMKDRCILKILLLNEMNVS